MALPASGPISMSMVNTELGLSATAVITLNDAAVRTLFGKPSGAISLSDGYGKSYYIYKGVIDTIGFRDRGRYFDGVVSSTGTSLELFCVYGAASDCPCCGQDQYDNCYTCDVYIPDTIPVSRSFSVRADGGYYDSGTKSGFVDFSVGLSAALTFAGQGCSSCTATLTLSDAFYLGVKTNGTLWAWGSNVYGQLGDGTVLSRSSPVQVGALTNWAKTDASPNSGHSLAIKTDGTLWAWGRANYGALGNGNENTNRSSPVQVGALTNWASVSTSGYGSHAIKTDGTLWAWGYNVYGQLGDGTVLSRSDAVQIGALTNWAKIHASSYYTTAIKTDGTLWAWGYNVYGQLGDGTVTNRSSPVQVGALTNWASVSADKRYNAVHAIKTDGTLWGWGDAAYGFVSNGFKSSPVQIGSATNHATLAKVGHVGMYYMDGGRGLLGGYPVITTSGSVILYHQTTGTSSLLIYEGGGATELIVADSEYDAFLMKTVVTGSYIPTLTEKAIFGYGYTNTNLSMTNLVSTAGVVASDTTGVGTARRYLAAAGYGIDKAIFGYGFASGDVSITNLVNNSGVVASDTTGVGTVRYGLAAAGYGTDKAIFGYGWNSSTTYTITNLVGNTGFVLTDITGVGTARQYLAAAGYGTDKAIFGYGTLSVTWYSVTNLVSNRGVVATDTTGVGTARGYLAAAEYSTDKAIFGYGQGASGAVSITNLVSNAGVVATDTTGVGTARGYLAATRYGTDKAIFGYGLTDASPTGVSMTNLVNNSGVVATDTTGVGTARYALAAAGF